VRGQGSRLAVREDALLDDVQIQRPGLGAWLGQHCPSEQGASAPGQFDHFPVQSFLPNPLKPHNLEPKQAIIGNKVVTAIPPQLRIEQVEVIFPHSETLGESFAEKDVFLVDPFFQHRFQVSGGHWILETLNFGVVFDVDLHVDVAIALGAHVVGQDEGPHQVEVEVRGDFFGVDAAGEGVLAIAADYVELLQPAQLQLDEVFQPAQVDSVEVVLVDLGGRLEDGETQLSRRLA
jgi:hypothetical protein